FCFYRCRDHRDLHSFPTRRSSDLVTPTALQLDNTAGKIEFHSRKSALRWDGFRSYGIFWEQGAQLQPKPVYRTIYPFAHDGGKRSEEHTSELQSRGHLVCRLLLEK